MNAVLADVRIGDHVKYWWWPDDRIMRVEDTRRHYEGSVTIIARDLVSGMLRAMPLTPAMVVVFAPMTDDELFECASALTRIGICPSCKATGSKHKKTCRYMRTLDDRKQS